MHGVRLYGGSVARWFGYTGVSYTVVKLPGGSVAWGSVTRTCSVKPPLTEEIIMVLKKMKFLKYPGEGRISGEMLKTSVRAPPDIWTALMNAILNTKEIPKNWTRSILVKVFKIKTNAKIGEELVSY